MDIIFAYIEIARVQNQLEDLNVRFRTADDEIRLVLGGRIADAEGRLVELREECHFLVTGKSRFI